MEFRRDGGLASLGGRARQPASAMMWPAPGTITTVPLVGHERCGRLDRRGVVKRELFADDGRDGIIKTFIAGGKPRVELYIPASIAGADTDVREDGPSALEQTGRWKIGGSGCYWDPNDTGPDQCSPNAGRWKIGSQGCYFDSSDSGPDQCQPAEGDSGGDATGYTCDYQGSPADCASEQQYEDFLATLADDQAEQDEYQSEYDSYVADCDANGLGCDDTLGGTESGPSAYARGCVAETAGTISGLAWSAQSLVQGWGLATGPIEEITVAAVVDFNAGWIAAAAATGGALYLLYNCVYAPVLDVTLVKRHELM
jgi:hypothetical protein